MTAENAQQPVETQPQTTPAPAQQSTPAPDPALAQQDAAAAAGAKKLEALYPTAWAKLKAARESLPSGGDIPGGRTFSSAGAAALAAKEAATPSPETQTREARRAELNRYDNPDGVYSKDPVKQKAAMAEMRRLLAAGQTQEELDAFANLKIGELRGVHGVDGPTRLPAALRNNWSEESEAEYLTAFHENGVASADVQAIYGWYVGRALSNGGQFTENDAVEFRALAQKRGFSKEFTEKLIKHHGGEEVSA